MPSPTEVEAAVAARLSRARTDHSRRVAETALRLASLHGLDTSDAVLAGWLHDWCRELPRLELLQLAEGYGLVQHGGHTAISTLHGPLAARLLPTMWPDLSEPVLQAIDRHTTGAPGMTRFDCLVYVSDLIEPGRTFDGVDDLRAVAERDLVQACFQGMDQGIADLLRRGKLIDARTVDARNDLLVRLRGEAL